MQVHAYRMLYLFCMTETPNTNPDEHRQAVLEMRKLIRWGNVSKNWLKLFATHCTHEKLRQEAINKLNEHLN